MSGEVLQKNWGDGKNAHSSPPHRQAVARRADRIRTCDHSSVSSALPNCATARGAECSFFATCVSLHQTSKVHAGKHPAKTGRKPLFLPHFAKYTSAAITIITFWVSYVNTVTGVIRSAGTFRKSKPPHNPVNTHWCPGNQAWLYAPRRRKPGA